MAKAKINEKHSLSVEGVLDVEKLEVSVEEIGIKSLKELFQKFDGENVKIAITYGEEITE
jgi:hypothetical protein